MKQWDLHIIAEIKSGPGILAFCNLAVHFLSASEVKGPLFIGRVFEIRLLKKGAVILR